MICGEYHMHTVYSDGVNTAEEMVQKCIALGYQSVGISDHSYTFFDETYCIKKESISCYIAEIKALKQKYASQIKLLCGIEHDMYSEPPAEPFDYIIGSMHYLKCDKGYFPVDESEAVFEDVAERFFGGDYLALAEAYFRQIEKLVEKTNCDIIGHFDLVTRFNINNRYFDETSPRYVAAYRRAADALLKYHKPFEINVRLMYKGLKTQPYPSFAIGDYIAANGGTFVLSSDAHRVEEIGAVFAQVENIVSEKGWKIEQRIF
ncbi:MAG: histidinol-phosphatase [Clostridia bacterium]|nr:histidinol-phosphatase [Clostridia bacterium]